MGQDGRKPATRCLVICHWSSEGHQRPEVGEELGKAINLSGHRCSHSTSALCRLQWCGFCGNRNSVWNALLSLAGSNFSKDVFYSSAKSAPWCRKVQSYPAAVLHILIQGRTAFDPGTIAGFVMCQSNKWFCKRRSLTVAKTLCNPQGAWGQFEVFPLPILRWARKERFELNSWLQHLRMTVYVSLRFFTYLGLIFAIPYLVKIPCWVY